MDLPTGCYIDPAVTARVCQSIESGQMGPARAAAFQKSRPSFRGAWSRLRERKPKASVFGHDAAKKLFGKYLPAWCQARGTCFPAGTPVAMADGTEKPIEAIRVGDRVLSHTGTPRTVTETMQRPYTGRVYSIAAKGWPFRLRMTEEHPVAVFANEARQKGFVRGDMKWAPAKDLKAGDFVLMTDSRCREGEVESLDLATVVEIPPLRQARKAKCPLITDLGIRFPGSSGIVRRHVKLNEQFGRLIGLYLAEGSCERRRVTWTFGPHERAFAEEVVSLLLTVFGVTGAISDIPSGRNVTRVRVDNLTFAAVITAICPGRATSKRVPNVVFRSSESTRLAVLRGWIDGDGHQDQRGNSLRTTAVTSSWQMNRDMHRLAMSCGLKPSSSFRKKAAHQTVAGTALDFATRDTVKIGTPFSADIDETLTKRGDYYSRQPEGVMCRIEDIVAFDVCGETVFNIEVEDEHSYVANGIAVHNCVGQGCGRAGQEAWLNALAFRGAIGRPALMSMVTLYPLSRELGQMGGCAPWGSSGGGDGSYVALAMQALALDGLLEAAVYGEYDLRNPREDLAVNFCNTGVPKILRDASAPYKLQAQNIASDKDCLTAIADALASRLTVAIALPRYTGPRNADGISVLQRAGDHCTFLNGVCTVRDRLTFVHQQSHCNDSPGGPNILKHDGGDEPLAPGESGLDAEDFMDNLRIRGEVWVVEVPPTVSWRAK